MSVSNSEDTLYRERGTLSLAARSMRFHPRDSKLPNSFDHSVHSLMGQENRGVALRIANWKVRLFQSPPNQQWKIVHFVPCLSSNYHRDRFSESGESICCCDVHVKRVIKINWNINGVVSWNRGGNFGMLWME